MFIEIYYKDLPKIKDTDRFNFERFIKIITINLLKNCLKKHEKEYNYVLNLYKIEFYIIFNVIGKLVYVRRIEGGFRIGLNNMVKVKGYSILNILKLVDYGAPNIIFPKRYVNNLFSYLKENMFKFALKFNNIESEIGGYNERIFI